MDAYYSIRRQKILSQAEGYLELGMPDHAVGVLTRWEQSSRLDGQARWLLGEALRSLERYDEALEPLLRAQETMPEDIHIYLALSWCFKRTGRLDRAIESLEQALLVDPNEAILYYNLACYWSLACNRAYALQYLHQALELDGGYRELINAEPDFDTIRDDAEFQALINVIV